VTTPISRDRFPTYAWAFAAYLIFVILFGAWVRIAGAGAGCGNHWPLCNGEVLPQAPATKTLIEFTHRITSGLSGILAIGILVWAWRRGPRRVRHAASAMMFFLLVEAFIGAVLVKKELVVNDASVNRAVIISLHLANTLLLMAAASATAWWATPRKPWNYKGATLWLTAALALIVLTNMTGAVTALGDTLFPKQPAAGGELLAQIRTDLSPSQHFLVRLRILHPIVAAFTAAFLIGAAAALRRRIAEPKLEINATLALAAAQVLLGLLNIALAAPAWMQILHLLAAQLLWISAFTTWLGIRERQA
jgi:heme a synthase